MTQVKIFIALIWSRKV